MTLCHKLAVPLVRLAVLIVFFAGVASWRAEEPVEAAPAFDFILWDGHRFARTPADIERDVRYVRDLGFTHSLKGARKDQLARDEVDAFAKYGLIMGFKYGFHRALDDFGKAIGLSEAEMIARGMVLDRKAPRERNKEGGMLHPGYLPLHPEVIKHYRTEFLKPVQHYLQYDRHNVLRLFLMGSEMGWSLPKTEAGAYSEALKLVYQAAREDGVFKPGQPNDYKALGAWWSGPHEKGRDWRLREAVENAILEVIPNADFMIDPIWSVKIVNGFGGDWSYIGDDPKNIADAVIRLKAQTRPGLAAHSTQLIRGANYETVLEANFLALCVGIDKLYHWGLHTIEPGHYPYYRHEGPRSDKDFPLFSVRQITDWKNFLFKLNDIRKQKLGRTLWAAMPPDMQEAVEAFADGRNKGGGLLDDEPEEDLELNLAGDLTRQVDFQRRLVQALNKLVAREQLFADKDLAAAKLHERCRELLGRRKNGTIAELARRELNHYLIEPLFPLSVAQTPVPNEWTLRERTLRKRRSIEPAVRATGRLLRERGALFRDWKPMTPRLALLGGLYTKGGLYTSFLTANLPFDLLRNARDRRTRLSSYRYAAVLKQTVTDADYADLAKIEQAGGTVFLPRGFRPPTASKPFSKAVTWDPGAVGKLARGASSVERRKFYQRAAKALRTVFHQGGLRPYFDSDDPRLILGAYTYQGRPMLFAVNDNRVAADPGRPERENKSMPLEVEIVVRDQTPGLRVRRLDTGAELPLTAAADGFRFTDTIEPAWYRLYAVLKPGEAWPGPPPLPAGPAVTALKAGRAKDGGVQLAWGLPFDDWVGCDVARYRIYRAEADGESALLADIEGRLCTGPGGVVDSWRDDSARPGIRYRYRIRTVGPLRREGPLSPEAVLAN